MPQQLSLELYQLIIQHVDDTADLLSVALCCSVFRDEAQRCLFRHIEAKSLHRHIPFPEAINASPLRLGPLVHTLDFTPLFGSNMMDRAWTVPLSLALRAMHNLKHLAIDRVNPSTVLQDCTFKLRSLSCGRLLHQSEVLFLLCAFLPTQRSMKRLQFIYNVPFDVAEVPKDLCPELDFLGVGDDLFIRALLRDTRPITRFEWFSLGTPPTMTTQQLNHLEYLKFNVYHSNMDNFFFTSNLTSLVHLELHVKLHTAGMLSQKLQFLKNIPRLEVLVFEIDGMHIHDILQGDEIGHAYHIQPAFTSAYQLAFELCPTLKYIYAGRVNHPIYHRFIPARNSATDVFLSDGFVHEREVIGWRLLV